MFRQIMLLSFLSCAYLTASNLNEIKANTIEILTETSIFDQRLPPRLAKRLLDFMTEAKDNKDILLTPEADYLANAIKTALRQNPDGYIRSEPILKAIKKSQLDDRSWFRYIDRCCPRLMRAIERLLRISPE